MSKAEIIRALQAKEWSLGIKEIDDDTKVDIYLSKSIAHLIQDIMKKPPFEADAIKAIYDALFELRNYYYWPDWIDFQIRETTIQYKAFLKDHLNSTIFNRIFSNK